MTKWMKRAVMPLLIVLLLATAGCSKGDSHDHQGKSGNTDNGNNKLAVGQAIRLANGDIQEMTASLDVAPSFLADQPTQVQDAYLIAANYQELLQYIPCMCGCGDSAGHASNQSCFIREVSEDGVIWDDHGTRCPLCMEIAIQSAVMKKDGKSDLEIRQAIDEAYGKGFAAPTKTKLPAA